MRLLHAGLGSAFRRLSADLAGFPGVRTITAPAPEGDPADPLAVQPVLVDSFTVRVQTVAGSGLQITGIRAPTEWSGDNSSLPQRDHP